MGKYAILTGYFLMATSLSTMGMAQITPAPPPPPSGSADVAQLLYQINRDLVKQQVLIKKAHKAVLSAYDDYVADPNATTYKALVDTATADAQAVQTYSKLVTKEKGIEAQIEKAARTYYEETPVTKAEIKEGLHVPGLPPGTDSIASEMNQSQDQIFHDLEGEMDHEKQVKHESDFAKALQNQMAKLQSVQDRIAAELKSPVVRNNQTAKNQGTDLKDIIGRAMDARRRVIDGEVSKK